ncbi:MAG: hypothetical protein HY063_05195 [Bacteroidetes bacterium]|nr:hypothetical protein [Bacteroidota bacterium]
MVTKTAYFITTTGAINAKKVYGITMTGTVNAMKAEVVAMNSLSEAHIKS